MLFVSYNFKKITLAYESVHNSVRQNRVVLLMINDKVKKGYYFAVKSMLEFYSFGLLKNKRAAINNDNNSFQNALNDALNS